MRRYRKLIIISCFCLLMGSPLFGVSQVGQEQEDIEKAFAEIAGKIHGSHPRVFINEAMIADIKTRAKEKMNRDHFRQMKSHIDKLKKLELIVLSDVEILDGTKSTDHEYGFYASESALLYLITEDKSYLDFAKKALRRLSQYYTARNELKRNIHWYSYSRIAALAAFDWIYRDLTEDERTQIGKPLLQSISAMVPDGKRKAFPRENVGDYTSGYYGTPALAWYAGLVFYKTGVDDNLAAQLLKKGFEDHWKLLSYRKSVAGDDGGSATPVMEYNIQAYPWAEFNFFHSVRSATGIDISQQWTTPLDLLYFVLWNWLPDNRHVGYGDVDHISNKLPLRHLYAHLVQMEHFYGASHPEVRPLLEWTFERVKRYPSDAMPFLRYIVDYYHPVKKAHEDSLPSMPSAMHFENMGQIFMRSGTGPNDTYALFSSGGVVTAHKHYDNNNFVIFRNGFRALDSGTRPQPGQHLSHYFSRTIAHNCILIRMPGEKLPEYWGGVASTEKPLPVPNDGGQRERIGSIVTGYSQNKQYVYIASDATKAYHEDKAKTVLRQFVFVQPDIFVVFDKVISKSPEYPKTWLLHTAAEPVFVKDNEFYETSQGGKLFCRTVFPVEAQATKIGGSGKQFWSDGQNWPLPTLAPKDWNYRPNRPQVHRDTIALFGQWRVEVTPKTPRLKDSFLHLIQVGDNKLKGMIASKAIEKDHKKGIAFDYQGKSYQILFTDDDTAGGSIRISEGEKVIVDEPFTSTVEHQQNIFKVN